MTFREIAKRICDACHLREAQYEEYEIESKPAPVKLGQPKPPPLRIENHKRDLCALCYGVVVNTASK